MELELRPQRGLERALNERGIPSFPDARTPQEEALWLLEVAAEIEHALMVEYLYAAYSARDSDLQNDIALVATQEMGHLLTVQNLRLALSGEPYLRRQDESPQADLDPFPFRLEPLSRGSLAAYVATEMPDEAHVPEAIRDKVRTIVAEAEAERGVDVHRVGPLYAYLYWLFLPNDDASGPWPDFPRDPFKQTVPGRHVGSVAAPGEVVARQGSPDEWGGGVPDLLIDLVADNDSALTAIYRIAAQGEGTSDRADSHFELFLRLYDDFVGGDVVLDVPVDPRHEPGPGDSGPSLITTPLAVLWSRLFDLRYRMLLANIQLSLAYPRGGPHDGLRIELVRWSVDEMRAGVKQLAQRLSLLPLKRDQAAGDPRRAAAGFHPLPSLMPTDPAATWRHVVELADASAVIAENMRSLVELDAVGRLRLKALEDLDKKRRERAAQQLGT